MRCERRLRVAPSVVVATAGVAVATSLPPASFPGVVVSGPADALGASCAVNSTNSSAASMVTVVSSVSSREASSVATRPRTGTAGSAAEVDEADGHKRRASCSRFTAANVVVVVDVDADADDVVGGDGAKGVGVQSAESV